MPSPSTATQKSALGQEIDVRDAWLPSDASISSLAHVRELVPFPGPTSISITVAGGDSKPVVVVADTDTRYVVVGSSPPMVALDAFAAVVVTAVCGLVLTE